MSAIPGPAAPVGKLDVVVVSLTTGPMIRGVLRYRAADAMVLDAAAQAREQQTAAGRTITWEPLTGTVVIPMERIDFWQGDIDPEALA